MMNDALLVEALLTTLRSRLMEKLELNAEILDEQIKHIKSYGYHKGLQSAVYDFRLASVSKEIEVLNKQIKELEDDLKSMGSSGVMFSSVLSKTRFKQFTDERSEHPLSSAKTQNILKQLDSLFGHENHP